MSPHRTSLARAMVASLGLCACSTPPSPASNAVPFVALSDIALQIQNGNPKETADEQFGGLIKPGTRRVQGGDIAFTVYSSCCQVLVLYEGYKRSFSDPNWLRDGQGVFLTGRLEADGVFHAQELTAADGLTVDDVVFRAAPR